MKRLDVNTECGIICFEIILDIAKNITSLPKGVKAYTTSQNLNKPSIEYDVTDLTHENFMEGNPSYHTTYETKYTHNSGEEHKSTINYYRYN